MAKRRSRRQSSRDSAPAPEPRTTAAAGEDVRAPGGAALPESDPLRKPFTPEVLDKTVIAIPLLNLLKVENDLRENDPARSPIVYDLIIDLNLEYHEGRQGARHAVLAMIRQACAELGTPTDQQGPLIAKSRLSQQYVFARLEARAIERLVQIDVGQRRDDGTIAKPFSQRAIYRIWNDFEVHSLTVKSVSTVKADAARNAFSAFGAGIVWAVMDSGIDASHPHFVQHGNLALDDPLQHGDFTGLDNDATKALTDGFGHGTHVAGIIAGEMTDKDGVIQAAIKHRDEKGDVLPETCTYPAIAGMAPKCKLVSLKVLNDAGKGLASNLIAAIEQVQEFNGHGRRILIHGVNMSVGYNFEPEWFACGQSPLCVEVDRLVRSGVIVVVAAGNTGYGYTQTTFRGPVAAGMPLSINDPGNAELAITVGSTHRDMPHVYGVSYFSSKGPTGDGRRKPDLVAPGEKIISCHSAQAKKSVPAAASAAPTPANPPIKAAQAAPKVAAADAKPAPTASGEKKETLFAAYKEDSGTSMAAPHVSGVIAAFLSVRREFIGRPEAVKEIFLSTATDLRRDPTFQGKGLVDLMRAIQSV